MEKVSKRIRAPVGTSHATVHGPSDDGGQHAVHLLADLSGQTRVANTVTSEQQRYAMCKFAVTPKSMKTQTFFVTLMTSWGSTKFINFLSKTSVTVSELSMEDMLMM